MSPLAWIIAGVALYYVVDRCVIPIMGMKKRYENSLSKDQRRDV
jgi:hypothetical protein